MRKVSQYTGDKGDKTMEKPISNYWQLRLGDLKEALEANNFEAFVAQNAREAGRLVMDRLLPKIAPKTISWGGSMTFVASELLNIMRLGWKGEKNAMRQNRGVRGGDGGSQQNCGGSGCRHRAH